jgi:ribosomal protein S18 acetylase RimI-like enzyme
VDRITIPGLQRRDRTTEPPQLLLARRDYDHPEARALLQALHAEQLTRHGFADDPHDTNPSDFRPPGLFVVGYLKDRPVACGGCRRWDRFTFEIKRMYVAPDHRGRGFGRSILQRLEEHARGAGARRIILETGARNAEALGLYADAGYHSIPTYAEARDPEVNRAFGKTIA